MKLEEKSLNPKIFKLQTFYSGKERDVPKELFPGNQFPKDDSVGVDVHLFVIVFLSHHFGCQPHRIVYHLEVFLAMRVTRVVVVE